jgi:hypothetical protein
MQDVSVTGNLVVLGNTTSINTNSFTVQDTMLILGLGNYTSDVLDIGFASHYNNGSNAHYRYFSVMRQKNNGCSLKVIHRSITKQRYCYYRPII